MPKAIWNGAVIAEAGDDEVRIVENNVYFPLSTVHQEFLRNSLRETSCGWKGRANYYHVTVAGKVNQDAAWTYRAPFDAAAQIAGHVAFWRGVVVSL
jgi:uncharacterized protein (DUF427 family)